MTGRIFGNAWPIRPAIRSKNYKGESVSNWHPVDWIVCGLLIIFGGAILLAAMIDVKDTGLAERILAGIMGVISAYVGAKIGSQHD